MPLFFDATSATFGTRLPFVKANELLARHLVANPSTLQTEAAAAALALEDFPPRKVALFVKAVCAWGGYAGVAGRVLNNNTAQEVATALRDSWNILNAPPVDPGKALMRLNSLHGLGTPSFASKHLRFLKPEVCPVFDSVLQEALPYPFSSAGYTAFSQDCQDLATDLNASGIGGLTHRTNGRWYAADVEAALYVFVRGEHSAA